MEQLKVKLNGHKISRVLPKEWTTSDKDKPNKEFFVLEDFAIYLTKMYDSLIGIKKNYQKEFDADSPYTIDDFIDLFNNAFAKIVRSFVPDSKARYKLLAKQRKDSITGNIRKRFSVLEDVPKNTENFVFKHGKAIGFTDELYKKINKYANQIFMIEKISSFTTRKFWQQEMTKADELDLNKKYKILVKCVFPNGWRESNNSKKFSDYMDSRAFYSTSLIDENHFYSTFLSFTTGPYALLLVDYDDKNFVCASPTDSYSEEVIDRKNLLKEKKIFSDILLQSEEDINNKNHKFFAEAVECETPKNLLENLKFYTEVNIRNIKPKAVIAPNKYSIEFAQQVAKEYGDLPVINKCDIE